MSGNHSNTVEPKLLLRRYLVVIGWRCDKHIPLLRNRAAHSAVSTLCKYRHSFLHSLLWRSVQSWPRLVESIFTFKSWCNHLQCLFNLILNFVTASWLALISNSSASKLRLIYSFCIIITAPCCFVGKLVICTCILTNLYIVFVWTWNILTFSCAAKNISSFSLLLTIQGSFSPKL